VLNEAQADLVLTNMRFSLLCGQPATARSKAAGAAREPPTRGWRPLGRGPNPGDPIWQIRLSCSIISAARPLKCGVLFVDGKQFDL